MIHDGVNVDINFSSPLSEIELHIPVTPYWSILGVRTILDKILVEGKKEALNVDLETIYWLNLSDITVRAIKQYLWNKEYKKYLILLFNYIQVITALTGLFSETQTEINIKETSRDDINDYKSDKLFNSQVYPLDMRISLGLENISDCWLGCLS